MNVKKLLFSLFAVAMLPLALFAQTTKEEVLQDLNRTGGVYLAYPVTESANTPAPKGYEPVYVSHFGRHGSRYLIGDRDYRWVGDLLHRADKAGALTPLGRDVMQRIDTLWLEARGRGGDLSPLGVRQHKGIAERMYKAYPQIFSNPKAVISARSTLVPRCILSMAAFTESLKEQNPKLQLTRESSERYMPTLNYHSKDHGDYTTGGRWKELYRKFRNQQTSPDRLVGTIFTDPEFVEVNVNPDDFMWGLYWIASDMQNVETPGSFYDLFTPDELFDLWQVENINFYINDASFGGNGTKVVDNGLPSLADIIFRADEALKRDVPGADLRFAHDGNLIPLAGVMHLKDCDLVESNPDNVYKAFADWKIAPMAGNIQLVFFRNKKNPEDVLVKFMLNERETSIPVDTDLYPFYHWSDVKAFYLPNLPADM